MLKYYAHMNMANMIRGLKIAISSGGSSPKKSKEKKHAKIFAY
jgi:hypothetical protein